VGFLATVQYILDFAIVRVGLLRTAVRICACAYICSIHVHAMLLTLHNKRSVKNSVILQNDRDSL